MSVTTPEPYQLLARDFLLDHAQAGLFMGMGLGKTFSTLLALQDAILLGQIRAALIVAPLRVCNLTWPAEVAKHGLSLRVASLRTEEGMASLRKGEADIYLINYEGLPKLVEQYLKGHKGATAFDAVIFDELTRAKNHSSKRINSFRRNAKDVTTRWGLTGTPTPNGYMELFAQIRLLDDGRRLGKDFTHFRQTYFEPEDYMEYNWKLRAGSGEQIQRRIADMVLTLKTSDYLDLPDLAEEDVEVALPDEAVKAYKTAEKEMLLLLEQEELAIANAAVLAGKLLQICSGAVYSSTRSIEVLHDAKIKALGGLLKDGPVLLACNYIHERERIAMAYPQAVDFASAKNAKAQEDLAARWNAGKVPLLMADPRSIGHGLNLQAGGNTVVWFSPTYSRELYDQMNARLFRKGQVLPVTVHRIIASNTIDDAVIEVLRTRGNEQEGLLNALRNLQKMRNTPAS